MKKAVLFDLDGTILASQPGIYRSIAYALQKLSLPMPDERELIAFLGPPLTIGFSQVCHVPEEQVDDAVKFYREYYNNGGMFEAYIYEGLPDVLNSLTENNIQCFITTSKPEVFAKRILAHFGIDTLFTDIYGSELNGDRVHKADVLRYCLEQQNLTADDVVLVGDRMYDAVGAADVGIPCIGITYGYGTREELEEAGATMVLDSAEEICAIVLNM